MKKLIIVGSFVAGAVAGFFAGWKTMEGRFAALANEEIESVKEAYGRRLDEIEEENANRQHAEPEIAVSVDTEKFDEAMEKAKDVIRTAPNPLDRTVVDGNHPYEHAKRNYNLISRPATVAEQAKEEDDEEDEEDTDDAGNTEASSKQKKNPNPYLIDSETYSEENSEYSKEGLYYYSMDDTLCDDQEEIVSDVGGTVGFDAIASLSAKANIWVRNELHGVDYEIIRVNKSYKEAVMGEAAQDPGQRRRTSKK